MTKLNFLLILILTVLLISFYNLIAQNQDSPSDFLKSTSGSTITNIQNGENISGKIEFPALPYSFDALEPYIDKQTLELHYSKHHKANYDNLIKEIKGTDLESKDIIYILKNVSKYSVSIRNNAGGYYNHLLYWENMKPKGGGMPAGKLMEAISKTFKSFEDFKKEFSESGMKRFGSGWVWLCMDANGKLFISSTPNADTPLMDVAEKKGTPLLTMDVWEHAYYLKYQNRRAEYIDAFWNVVNWDVVAKRYEAAMK